MISIRATNLEKFITCPYRYKFEPAPSPDNINFKFGTAIHKLIEIYVQDIVTQEAIDIILYPRGVKERKMLQAMTNIFMQNIQDRELEYVLSEYSFTHKFEDIVDENGEHPILEGTFDLLFKDKDGKYIIVDIKSASSNRDEEHIEGVNQKRIYPALLKLCSGFDVHSFEYRVMKKTLSPQIQEIKYEIPDDNTETVKQFMEGLVAAEDGLVFPKHYPNYTCFFCKLRDGCKNG